MQITELQPLREFQITRILSLHIQRHTVSKRVKKFVFTQSLTVLQTPSVRGSLSFCSSRYRYYFLFYISRGNPSIPHKTLKYPPYIT